MAVVVLTYCDKNSDYAWGHAVQATGANDPVNQPEVHRFQAQTIVWANLFLDATKKLTFIMMLTTPRFTESSQSLRSCQCSALDQAQKVCSQKVCSLIICQDFRVPSKKCQVERHLKLNFRLSESPDILTIPELKPKMASRCPEH